MDERCDAGRGGGLVRPSADERDAVQIGRECFGIEAEALELGSNQDRNFLLTADDGGKYVLRVDNAAFGDDAREAQHAAIDAYRAAGVPVAAVVPGIDGRLTQRWGGYAVRLSEFAEGETLVDAGYLAPVVRREFGALSAASSLALAGLRALDLPGLDRENPWDMRVAYEETLKLAPAITDDALRRRVLAAAECADEAIGPLAGDLPVQAVHGDLTDDNVMALPGDDARRHPRTIIDLGDLGYGWRVAELAVTVSSLLHHDPERPHAVLEAIEAFHAEAPLSEAEARTVWPLVQLRAALLVASGWRQLEIDGANDYARDRIAGEQAIFDAATRYSLVEFTEDALARLGFSQVPEVHPVAAGVCSSSAAGGGTAVSDALRALIPSLDGVVELIDPGVESPALDAGRWLEPDAETRLVERALENGAAAAVLPYGVFRLTRTHVDEARPSATWPTFTEVWLPRGEAVEVLRPHALEAAEGWSVLLEGAPDGVLEASDRPRKLRVSVVRDDIEAVDVPGAVVSDRVPAWSRLTADPAPLLGLPGGAEHDTARAEQARRESVLASAQERYYDRPMQIERGWRHHLVDVTGRAYVDLVNNVSGLGHGHAGVADAVNRQMRLLGTNSRFLYRSLAEYSERLLAELPEALRESSDGREALDTVLLVNSGSEAVDLALRLVQAATGRRTIIALREAYHGWTMASDAVTTSAYDNPFALATRPDWVHVADVPNRFRGTYRGGPDDLTVGARYAADLGNELGGLAADGRQVAGFICESVLGNAGGVLLPDGYLADAYDRVRAAGGLCIADEVQVGFGRMGSTFWGFEQSGVLPDLITIAKPMGNGFPIGGVITSKRVADALATQGQFFSSAGGNPVSCAVGIAVLDAMEVEGLQENARVVGDRLASGVRSLAQRHRLIGPVHGEGLYLGIELVRSRETLEPAKPETAAICERLRELGVIVQPTSERSNVLKVKPPLTLSAESADFVVAQLDRVLTEGW